MLCLSCCYSLQGTNDAKTWIFPYNWAIFLTPIFYLDKSFLISSGIPGIGFPSEVKFFGWRFWHTPDGLGSLTGDVGNSAIRSTVRATLPATKGLYLFA